MLKEILNCYFFYCKYCEIYYYSSDQNSKNIIKCPSCNNYVCQFCGFKTSWDTVGIKISCIRGRLFYLFHYETTIEEDNTIAKILTFVPLLNFFYLVFTICMKLFWIIYTRNDYECHYFMEQGILFKPMIFINVFFVLAISLPFFLVYNILFYLIWLIGIFNGHKWINVIRSLILAGPKYDMFY